MPNDVALEVYYDGAWHDLVIDDKVLAEQSITITRGDGAESAAPRPASLVARLNNDDDTFRTSNPESPLYGKAGRNTPVRVSVGGVVRAATEASSWRAGQTRDFRARPKRGKAWVDLESGGLLERVNQWKEPLRSAFYAHNAALTTAVGYWPCEEKRGAQTLTAVTPGSFTRTLRGGSFDGQSYPAGSAPVLELTATSGTSAAGTFAPSPGPASAGWQVSWVAQHKVMPGTGLYSLVLRVITSEGTWFTVYIGDNDKIRVIVTPLDASSVLDTTATLPSVSPELWACYSLRVTESAGTVTVTVYRVTEEETVFTQVYTGNYVGTLATLARWNTNTGLGLADVGFGHLIGVYGTTEDLGSNARATALKGHAGERAAYRFARLCDLKGIPYFVRGDSNLSVPMGPQRVATLAEQFREIRDTEDGLIFDEKGGLYLIFAMLNHRYRQTATSIDVTEMPSLPAEVTDDLGVHNIVTVQNAAGGEATATDTTGPLGTAPPPDGAGEYEFSVDVSLDDTDDLPQLANWWLRRGTVDLPRYPQVTVNLAALDAARVAAIEDIDVGDVIEITGYRENTIRLWVIGYTETIGWPNERRITFTCAPDQQFQVGEWDATTSRYDLATCTTSGSHGPTATTITLAITADEAWSSTSAYDLFIAGELVGVPVGGMGARTGTAGAYQQVLTGAVRSKNGIRKTLPAGSAVHVSTPGRWAR